MNKISKRENSASPSRSIEFGKRQPLLKKRLDKQSKEDVKVFTSLPPNVEGDIKFYLRLKILNVNLIETNVKPDKLNKKLPLKLDNLIARCVWWGEENSVGSIFRPRIQSKYFKTEDKIQTTALYMVRSGAKQFSAYLNDMKTLDIDLINETSMQIIARVQLFEIGQLTVTKPIKGYFSAFDESQKKIADVNLSIELESVKGLNEIKKQTDASDTSRPATPASQANLDDFNTKYEQFEKNQLKKQQFTDSTKTKFDSISYKTTESNSAHSNPIISSLIQRAERLKSELIKSSNTNLYDSNKLIDDYNEIDLDFEESITYEPSYLFDKIEYASNEYDIVQENDDKELNELLNPTGLFSKLLSTKPNHNRLEYFKNEPPQRPYSTTNSINFSSEDETYKPNKNVSFEIQSSSDGESSVGSIENDMSCVDSLSPQRLSLLNLVQIAKLKIENIDFYSSFSTNVIKSIENEINQHQRLEEKRSNSKPPKAVKTDLNQIFFIEYQFPVLSNTTSNELLNATQVMRVVPKRVNKSTDKIHFEHSADYSVLFSSIALENWWRSHIVFKIYMRSSQTKTPVLIGMARLKLRNLLKSRNFKLLKKLAVLDKLNQNEKRIGTLNVSIELASDLNEFHTDLQKLKNTENNLKFKPKPFKPQQQIVLQPQPVVNQLSIEQIKPSINEPSIPIDFYLSVSEGREFSLSLQKNNIYLICRLFWNKEKVKLESNLNLSWTLNLSFMIKKSLIDNMRNNFMIIEVWSKSEPNDSLIGTVKLSLQEFYLKFNDFNLLKQLLGDSITYTQPTIGCNGWISVLDPFTGYKSGEFNILLALGSNKQILNLQKLLFDQSRVKLAKPIKNNESNEHVITIRLDQIKLQPLNSELQCDETDFYVKYSFLNAESIFKSYLLGTKLNKNFDNFIEHKFYLNELKQALYDFFVSKHTSNNFIRFELWKRSYYPNLREKYLARGEVLVEKFFSLILTKEQKSSLIIPLLSEDSLQMDKFIGQLFIDLEYKCILNSIPNQIVNEVSNELTSDSSNIVLSVGVLRASRLQTLIKSVASKSDIRCLNLENSEIYAKFSLAFINKPLDFKQTHRVVTKLNGYSPEFFDYFEIECPLIALYNSFNKRTISLAEQIELGQIIFEIWSKYSDSTNQNCTEVLLGTCVVGLEALLDNRIGIRGWLPIQSTFYSSSKTELSEHSVAGGLEIAIRFTKHDDYLRIIESAKEIGWLRGAQLISDLNKEKKHHKELVIPPLVEEPSKTSDRKTIKCLIEIDKAVRLPNVFDRELNTDLPVNSYVSFNTNLDNPNEIMKTTICEQDSSPKWNQQFLVNIDSEYFLDDKKYFILKVWHKSGRQSDKLLGCVSIDMTPLLCGLSHLSGWYNIQDSIGNNTGQIKVNILPQENLFSLKQIVTNRKKCMINNQEPSRISSFRLDSINMSYTLSVPRFFTSTERTSPLNNNKNENKLKQSSSNFDLTQFNLEEYKLGLKQKLNELEQLNRKLKEKLDVNDDLVKQVDQNEQNLVTNLENKENKQEDDDGVIELVNEKINIQTEQIQTIEIKSSTPSLEDNKNDDLIENSRLNDSLESEHHDRSFGQIEELIANEVNDKVIDSFWINSEKIEEKLNDEVKENKEVVDDTNETYLDQTIDFNASLELQVQKNTDDHEEQIEQQVETNIIDCNELDEIEIKEINYQDDKNNENDIIIEEYKQDSPIDQVEEQEEDEENLTFIMPEQLNQIKEVEPEASKLTSIIEPELNINDKLKDMSSKIPNYFLAQDDLESKMRKLHYNYVQISVINESKNEESTKKTTSKSTLSLINESNTNLDRINKIFYSNFK